MEFENEFERKFNRKFPESVKKIIDFQIKNKAIIEFEVPNFHGFEIIKFSDIIPLIGFTPNSSLENLNDCNDYYSLLLKDMEYFLKRSYPVISYSNILPFAQNNWGDKTIYLLTANNEEKVLLIDLDSLSQKPIEYNFTIDAFVDLNKLIIKGDRHYFCNTKAKFKNIINLKSYFFDAPDGIFDVIDYRSKIEKCLNLLENSLEFKFKPILDSNSDFFTFLMEMGGVSKTATISVNSKYINGKELIGFLNELLTEMKHNESKLFYELSNNICDFGVAFVDKKTAELLNANGYLYEQIGNLEYSQEEKEVIEVYEDLRETISNIKYLIKNKSKDFLDTVNNESFYDIYKTKVVFDDTILKKLVLNYKMEDIQKSDDGYFLFFNL